MRDLISTNDPVLVSYVSSLLADAGIRGTVLDSNMSVLEGSIGVLPQRITVADADWPGAAALLRDAGLGEWIAKA